MRQKILIIIGILGFIFGVLFALQGLGVLPYPKTSFMVNNRDWVLRGAIIAGLSAILVAGVRLVPDKRRKGDGEG
ncbi:hypothetical protein [Sphingomonas sp.]|uniref:hypothetical protein n=1 Tax=Sphingomonas sp. TaxID=28214 RepID=UPI001B07B9A5|nr:hypothetical protein [Sphingomonas sp.]MBO9712821.1 hypothetical protein [Sphingomonas sp.]